MVQPIGAKGALAREAVLAALQAQAQRAEEVRASASQVAPGLRETQQTDGSSFTEKLQQGLQAVDGEVRAAEELPQALLSGKVNDFHEVAVQLKRAEFSFQFAMEVRNKLIDAYREVMRMNV